MSNIRVFMNFRQHSEAAAKRSLNELSSPGQSTVLCTIYIPKTISYVWYGWSWGPCLMDYRIQWYWQAAITCFDLYLASPCGGRGCVPFQSLSQDGYHLPTTAFRPWPLTRYFTFPFTSLILAHWLHPAHFNLIFLPHVPRPSVDESVQLLPCLMLVWKLGTFPPKDQNKQVGVKDHKTIGSQAKHKSFEHNIHTRVNSGLPLCTWAGALAFPHTEQGSAGVGRGL